MIAWPRFAEPGRTESFAPNRSVLTRDIAMRFRFALIAAIVVTHPAGAQPPAIQVRESADEIQIDTDALQAKVRKRGYVSGIAAGSFLDKKTGARDLGFGLHIMDFLLGPGWRDDEYTRDKKYHGDLPKHYVEGPQICT